MAQKKKKKKRKHGIGLDIRIPKSFKKHTLPTRLFTAAPFVKTPNWELSKCTPIAVWIHN